ncbi:hypothetical protein K3495_g8314 [Podosphaera aphanis]|nr:hypothetical protein K3495_g8314 [Podosphaera aphanis]
MSLPSTVISNSPDFDFTNVSTELSNVDLGILIQDPEAHGKLLDRFISSGSQVHKLVPGDIRVYISPEEIVPIEDQSKHLKVEGGYLGTTINQLLAGGACFFDAFLYLSLKPEKRPPPHMHARVLDDESETEGSSGSYKFTLKNDWEVITEYLFVIYFYILLRAHAPSELPAYVNQPMPPFLKTTLGIKTNAVQIANYMSSFDLIKMNPAWVTSVQIKNLSHESQRRLGLGIAGYRYCSVFMVYPPDRFGKAEQDLFASVTIRKGKGKGSAMIEAPGQDSMVGETVEVIPSDDKDTYIKPKWLDGAVVIAKSFIEAGYCWDFHPATRNPQVLSLYGNINKNLQNLMIACYKSSTLETMKAIKKIPFLPTYDPVHKNFMEWHSRPPYRATKPIFKDRPSGKKH